MKIWKAHYVDANHDLDIDILNTEEDYSSNPLSFCINGIPFSGTSLGDFQLADSDLYETARKEFSLLKWGGNLTKYKIQSDYQYDLQRYSLDVKIPVTIIKKSDEREVSGYLRVCFAYCEHNPEKNQSRIMCDNERVYRDDINDAIFTLCADGEEYCVSSQNLYFEPRLMQLIKLMKDKYVLKCCFTCQYSDYSPYGCDDYGTMLCYRKHKREYLKVNDKSSYFKYVEGLDCEAKQETYLCDEYEPRIQCGGYRGFVE